ncbi:hypothetical protein [Acinetobacter sp. NCu2D-2]|uniref:hypothetical protein n=1 Tax=Acinetobacter sp. NCu2D-2 TaxID=1608473 RepID=UPI001D0CFE42|nr:hypothetical protein [Acinetobacter sp. NCu2D-2]
MTALPFYLEHIETDAKNKAKININNYANKMLKINIHNQPSKEAYKILCSQNLCAILVINGKEKSLEYYDPKDISFPLKSLNK